jgi:hypothetical protein
MNHNEPPEADREERIAHSIFWIYAVVLPLLGLGTVILIGVMNRGVSPATTKTASSSNRLEESGVETARQGLSRQTDLNACRSALQQINTEMGEKASLRPPALTTEHKDWLLENVHLNKEELIEVESSHYTRLDNQHLFRCFLMRDAASALEVKGVRGQAGGQPVQEKPLDQAVRAFAWVMREVRLHPEEGEASPPSFVLRRGWGSALERALVFLATLEQLGESDAPQPELLGFLLEVPPPLSPPGTGGDKGGGGMNLWTCGVVIGDSKAVYLFDPYLGLPLPGPNGQGVATLAQAREQSEILAQLNVGEKNRYPVTREQAQAAEAQLVCPLSALSPRMRYLQDKLLAPAVRVRLASDTAKDVERIKAACAAGAPPLIPPPRGGDKGGVQVPKDECTLLRRFLPVDEGGADSTSRQQRFQFALVPWNNLPAVFQDERLFPRKSMLGMQVLAFFAAYFIPPTMEAGYPRDLLLRGRFGSAVEKLASEQANWRSAVEQRANAGNLEEQFQKWLDEATRVYANLARAKLPQEREQAEKQAARLWNDRSSLPVHIVLNSAAAAARNPEVDYQLGMCHQEQAEQLQARLDLQAQARVKPFTSDVETARKKWQHALDHWKLFEEESPKHRDIAAARRLRARAQAMLGDHRAAIASWRNVSDCPTELEKLASLYLAQQWENKHADKAK